MHVAAPTSHDVETTTRQAYGTGKPTEAVACRQGNCGTTCPGLHTLCPTHTGPNIGIVAAGTHLDGARPHAVQWQLGPCTASSRRRTTATIGHVQTLAGPMRQTRHEPTNTAHRPNTSTSRTNVGLFRPYEQGQTKTKTDRSASRRQRPQNLPPRRAGTPRRVTLPPQTSQRDETRQQDGARRRDRTVLALSLIHLS